MASKKRVSFSLSEEATWTLGLASRFDRSKMIEKAIELLVSNDVLFEHYFPGLDQEEVLYVLKGGPIPLGKPLKMPVKNSKDDTGKGKRVVEEPSSASAENVEELLQKAAKKGVSWNFD